MSILQKIRLTSAIVLIFTSVLPLSECTRHDNALHPPRTFVQHLFPQDNPDFAYQYAFTMLKPSTWQGGCIALIALGWPLGLFFITRKQAGSRFAWILYAAELLLAAGTIYWLWMFTALGEWLYGAYIVCVAIGVYVITTLILLVGGIRNRRERQTP